MKAKIEELTAEIQQFNTKSEKEIEEFRIRFLGSKGLLKQLNCVMEIKKDSWEKAF